MDGYDARTQALHAAATLLAATVADDESPADIATDVTLLAERLAGWLLGAATTEAESARSGRVRHVERPAAPAVGGTEALGGSETLTGPLTAPRRRND
jgi:hypothetical protein